MYLYSRQKGGHRYWYLREKRRVNGTPTVVLNRYLGPDSELIARLLAAEKARIPEVEVESFPFGTLAAFLGVEEELGLTRIIEEWTGSRATALACLAFICARAEEPLSKNRMPEWFQGSLLKLLIPDMPSLTSRSYLYHMDKLTEENVREVTFGLARRMVDLGYRPSIVFFDPTNFSTEQQPSEEDPERQLAKVGHAKDGNAQAKLVGLATAVTSEHLPVFHEVFPGNENDAKLFQEVVEEMLDTLLKLGVASEDLVFVFDKGVSSEDGWRLLARHRTHFVSSLKRVQVVVLLARPMSAYGRLYLTEQGELIRGFRVSRTVLGILGTVVVAYNESAHRRQERDYARAKGRFLAQCQEIAQRLSRPHRGRRSTIQSLTERIEDALPPKWRGVFKYHVGATLDSRFQVRAWVDPKKEKELRSGFGKTVLFTDRTDWTDEKIVRTYFARSAMEEDFHVLKDVLLMPVMPIFHRKDPRIRVHGFLCVMGLLFYRWVQLRAEKELGVRIPIDRLARSLSGIRVAAVTDLKGKGGRFVLEKVRDERKELVTTLKLARRVPN